MKLSWTKGLFFCLLLPASLASAQVHWKCSTADKPWADKPDLAEVAAAPAGGATILVDPNRHYQTMDGWGGCFNERGWRALQMLTETDRTSVLRQLFDPSEGLKLNICRTPIAASDYAVTLYSYDETPGDYEMKDFSIERDRRLLIPYIKVALAIQPNLKIWGVPWSPPSWMKDSGKLAGGHILTDAQTMDALALYFAKYVQAYRAEGLPLFMIMPQNEPCYSTKYTSCEWTGDQLGLFVRNHLGPLFKSLNLDCQIYLGTFPRSDAKKYDYSYWLGTALRDPLTRSFVTGVGCQWGGDGVMRDAGRKNPGIKLMQTEAECGETNTNDWDFAHRRFDDIVKFLNCGAESFMIWNMVLDETGESTAGWDQCSPIVIDQVDQPGVQVRYTPYYYAFKHFSSFVVPGSVRVDAASSGPACEAFIAPGGQVVVVTENAKPYPQALHLAVSGHHFSATLPALSFNSFVLDATAAGK